MMKAMLLDQPGRPLRLAELPRPDPGPGHVRLRVGACAVCRTDLHVVDGDRPLFEVRGRSAEQRVAQLQSQNARRQQAGQRPSGSGRQTLDPARMRDFNPFCPSTSSPRYQSDVDRNYKLVYFLQSRAQGRHARLSISTAGPPLYW